MRARIWPGQPGHGPDRADRGTDVVLVGSVRIHHVTGRRTGRCDASDIVRSGSSRWFSSTATRPALDSRRATRMPAGVDNHPASRRPADGGHGRPGESGRAAQQGGAEQARLNDHQLARAVQLPAPAPRTPRDLTPAPAWLNRAAGGRGSGVQDLSGCARPRCPGPRRPGRRPAY